MRNILSVGLPVYNEEKFLEETLVSILAGAGDITTYRRSWRENY